MATTQETLQLLDTEQAFHNLFSGSSCVRQAEVLHDERLSRDYGADVFLLSELGQTTGAYKIRGAYNWFVNNAGKDIDSVVAFSAGNHAAAVAACAKHFETEATIFMPANTPAFKFDLVRRLGGNSVKIVSTGRTVDDAALAGREYLAESSGNSAFIHPFDDPDVVSGQGTLGVELAELMPEVDYAVIPVGGGGLLSGIMHASRENDRLHFVGVEPSGAPSLANNMEFPDGPLVEIDTFVDGAAVKQVGSICLNTVAEYEDRLTLAKVENSQIRRATTEFWEKDTRGLRPELAGALSVAGLDSVRELIMGKTVVCVISGGNLSWQRYENEVRYL